MHTTVKTSNLTTYTFLTILQIQYSIKQNSHVMINVG